MKKSVYTEIEEAKKQRAETLAELKNKLAKCETDKSKAETEAAEALTAGNADAYARAKDAERTAADKIEFYNIKIDELKDAALFSGEEKKVKAEAIKASAENVKAAKMKEAAQLIVKAAALADEVREENNKANTALNDIGSKSHISNTSIAGLYNSLNAAKNHADITPYIN